MNGPLTLLEGVFHESEDALVVLSDGGDTTKVDSALERFEGEVVQISLHHLPPTPMLHAVGGGSCLWAGYCPCGHERDPAWLHSLDLKGVLSRTSSGNWAVSGESLGLFHYMLGHRGRLVILRELTVSPEKDVGELLDEAQSMLGLLKGLRGALES